MEMYISLRIVFNHMASHVAIVTPMYSAYVLDNAIVDCFFLLHDMAPLPKEKTNPNVDCLSAL